MHAPGGSHHAAFRPAAPPAHTTGSDRVASCGLASRFMDIPDSGDYGTPAACAGRLGGDAQDDTSSSRSAGKASSVSMSSARRAGQSPANTSMPSLAQHVLQALAQLGQFDAAQRQQPAAKRVQLAPYGFRIMRDQGAADHPQDASVAWRIATRMALGKTLARVRLSREPALLSSSASMPVSMLRRARSRPQPSARASVRPSTSRPSTVSRGSGSGRHRG